jgi:chemotaxis protein CheD
MDSNPAKFPQSAVPRLLELMMGAGAQMGRISARLAGGASMFAALAPPGTISMGERNLVAARQVLNSHSVPLVGEAVGGDFGRTVRLNVADGRVEVITVAHGVQHL